MTLGNSKESSELTFRGDSFDEVLNPTEINARFATIMSCETGNVNASPLDSMDIDSDPMDIDSDPIDIDSYPMDIDSNLMDLDSNPMDLDSTMDLDNDSRDINSLVKLDTGCQIRDATSMRGFGQMGMDSLDIVGAGDTNLKISKIRKNSSNSPPQTQQLKKQKLPRDLEGGANVRFRATGADLSKEETTREGRHWTHAETKAHKITALSNRLIGDNPIDVFAVNCEKTLLDWIKLLSIATLPDDIQSTDRCIITAFKAVDSVICGQGTNMLRRLAHVHLIRLFGCLEAIVKTDRVTGRIHRERHYRDDHIAMDIYMNAQEAHSNTNELRLKIKRGRKRFSKRWSVLAKASPLFLLVYPDAAESIMYVPPAVKCFVS